MLLSKLIVLLSKLVVLSGLSMLIIYKNRHIVLPPLRYSTSISIRSTIWALIFFLMAFRGSRGRNGCDNDLRLGLGDTDQSLERIQAESNVQCRIRLRRTFQTRV